MTKMNKTELEAEVAALSELGEKTMGDLRTMTASMEELERKNNHLQQIVNGLNKRHEDLLQMAISQSMAIKVLAQNKPD